MHLKYFTEYYYLVANQIAPPIRFYRRTSLCVALVELDRRN